MYTAFFMQNHVRIFPQTTPMNILFIYIVLVVNFDLWYYPAITVGSLEHLAVDVDGVSSVAYE